MKIIVIIVPAGRHVLGIITKENKSFGRLKTAHYFN